MLNKFKLSKKAPSKAEIEKRGQTSQEYGFNRFTYLTEADKEQLVEILKGQSLATIQKTGVRQSGTEYIQLTLYYIPE